MRTNAVLMSRPWTATAVTLLLTLGLTEARADTVDIGISTSAPSSETPGASEFGVTFTFDFHASGTTTVAGFDYKLTYDPKQLSMDPTQLASIATQTGQFTPFGTDTFLNTQSLSGGVGTYTINPLGPLAVDTGGTSADGLEHLNASWYNYDSNFTFYNPLTPAGTASVTYLFTLAASATPGAITNVTLVMDYTDADLNNHPQTGSGQYNITVPITVAASTVPLPASGLLMSVGFAVIGAFLRRRRSEPS